MNMQSFLIGGFLAIFGMTVTATETNPIDDPIAIADFEGSSYGAWIVTGEAFGKGPAPGTLPGQMHVEGYLGKGLVNSFLGGDDAVGKLTSPEFKIERRFITFLIGGGAWSDETCMNLLLEGRVVRTATGSNSDAGGSERLSGAAWDVSDLLGKMVVIEIIDSKKGGWGHLNVDQIVQTNDRGENAMFVPPPAVRKDVSVEISLSKRWLQFPVKNGGKKRLITIQHDGKEVRSFDIALADGEPDWWAPLDVGSWIGTPLRVTANVLPENSKALESLKQSDRAIEEVDLYQERLRSQFHFSPKRGWTNDPNGLVFFGGEYHLFFQHNPYGWDWGNMHWGHATSTDLVHWKEHGEALYPDTMGPMFSGSAVVDWENSSGFGTKEKPPLVLIYTAAGNPTTQCIAYTLDGRNFTKYDKNPVIPQISGGNRDPKVIWHSPSKQWILVLYVETNGKQHTVHFFTSKNLREWKQTGIVPGGIDGDKYLFECPDFFELPVDDRKDNKKWVLNSANSEYAIGSFDGSVFHSETSRIADVRGLGFYAAQTFSDVKDGRRIQIGWLQAPSPGMSFNQLQSIPCELTLRTTSNGIRIFRKPVQELQQLRSGDDQSKDLSSFRSDLMEVLSEWNSKKLPRMEMTVRGAKIVYDSKLNQLSVNEHRVPVDDHDGRHNIHIYLDRTVLEIFLDDGLIYVPMPWIAKEDNQQVQMKEMDSLSKLEVYSLKSSWGK